MDKKEFKKALQHSPQERLEQLSMAVDEYLFGDSYSSNRGGFIELHYRNSLLLLDRFEFNYSESEKRWSMRDYDSGDVWSVPSSIRPALLLTKVPHDLLLQIELDDIWPKE